MLEINARDFVESVSHAGLLYSLAVGMQAVKAAGDRRDRVRYELLEDMLSKVNKFEQHCRELELPTSAAGAERLRSYINGLPLSDPSGFVILDNNHLRQIQHLSEQLQHRLIDELGDRLFLSVKSEDAKFYGQNRDFFGGAVYDRFPEAVEDLDEAGTCFALGRYTASVFHLMRAMEVGVIHLADSVGATVEDKNGANLTWGKLLANIKGKIDGLSDKQKREELYEIHALLHSVKEAWRNSSMHPKRTYNREEVSVIIIAVGAFMDRLARL